jgi:hypothetical protein
VLKVPGGAQSRVPACPRRDGYTNRPPSDNAKKPCGGAMNELDGVEITV